MAYILLYDRYSLSLYTRSHHRSGRRSRTHVEDVHQGQSRDATHGWRGVQTMAFTVRSHTPLFAHSDRSQKRRPRLSSRHSTIAHDGSAGPQRSGFACHTQFTACTGSAVSTAATNLCRRTRKKSFWQHIEHSRCMSFRVSSHICEHFKTIHQLHLSSHRYQLALYVVDHHENPDSTRDECVQS